MTTVSETMRPLETLDAMNVLTALAIMPMLAAMAVLVAMLIPHAIVAVNLMRVAAWTVRHETTLMLRAVGTVTRQTIEAIDDTLDALDPLPIAPIVGRPEASIAIEPEGWDESEWTIQPAAVIMPNAATYIRCGRAFKRIETPVPDYVRTYARRGRAFVPLQA